MIKRVLNPNYKPVKLAQVLASTAEQKKASESAMRLMESFPWSKSAEGVDFWDSVYQRLSQIGKNGILKEH